MEKNKYSSESIRSEIGFDIEIGFSISKRIGVLVQWCDVLIATKNPNLLVNDSFRWRFPDWSASETLYFNSRSDSYSGANSISGDNPGSVTGANCDSQVDSDSGADADSGIDFRADSGIGSGVNSRMGSGIGSGIGIEFQHQNQLRSWFRTWNRNRVDPIPSSHH